MGFSYSPNFKILWLCSGQGSTRHIMSCTITYGNPPGFMKYPRSLFAILKGILRYSSCLRVSSCLRLSLWTNISSGTRQWFFIYEINRGFSSHVLLFFKQLFKVSTESED